MRPCFVLSSLFKETKQKQKTKTKQIQRIQIRQQPTNERRPAKQQQNTTITSAITTLQHKKQHNRTKINKHIRHKTVVRVNIFHQRSEHNNWHIGRNHRIGFQRWEQIRTPIRLNKH